MRRAFVLAFVAAGVAFAATTATATTLYTWIDAQGRTQYSDQPPKDFTGEVRRIETDAAPPAAQPPAAQPVPPQPAAPAATPAKAPPAATDMAARRRATRARLEGELTEARENLDRARRALADGQQASPEERQLVRRPLEPEAGKPAVNVPSALRANCRTVLGTDGKQTVACPVSVPTEAYYERLNELEEAVRRAESELEAAQLAYRRGVD